MLTALNPMTYVSEGSAPRWCPSVPHIRPWVSLLVLAGSIAAFAVVGVRGFYRRAVD